MTETTKRIAMWSGPRNLSTAMMYSFGARADCTVRDEPFYAAYLHRTGADHPMRDEILAAHSVNPDAIVADLLGQVATPVFYQKHMAHHMVDGIRRDWIPSVTNVFLIRHPARVLASYAQKREGPTLEDIGFPQLAAMCAQVNDPIVVDSSDIRADPAAMLHGLTDALGIAWDPAMLSWPRGGHPGDGAWAAHWYGSVHTSTGFAGPEGDLPTLPPEYQDIADAAMPYYDQMARLRLRI